MLTASASPAPTDPATCSPMSPCSCLRGDASRFVGGNGTGKTSLIEILVGDAEPDRGSITKPKDMTLGYLPQDLVDTASGSVIEEVLAGAGEMADLTEELHRLEAAIFDPDAAADADAYDTLLAQYGQVQSQYESMGGYALEADARKVLAGLGFKDTDGDRPVRELRVAGACVALARLLLAKPDVLILDEPTNHLDVDSVAWLEQQLAAWPGPLFVSHDRDFIDAVADRVIELAEGTALEYVGGFAEFVVQREERLQRIEAAAARQAREIAKVEQFIDRFRYKATKARQVQSRIKTIEKLEQIKVPERKELVAKFAFPEPPRSSRVIAEFNDATVGYGDIPVVGCVTPVSERQVVALVGPNGAGKTTLLKLILGELEASAGTAELGNNVKIATFHQHQADELDLDKTVVAAFSGGIDPGKRNLRTVLGSFGFPVMPLTGWCATSPVANARACAARTMIEGEPARARRAHQPSRPAELRCARGRAHRLPRHRPPRHPRPPSDPQCQRCDYRRPRWRRDLARRRARGDPHARRPSKVAAAGTSLSAGTGGEHRTADSEAGGGRKTARQASAKARQNTNELRKRVQKLERALEKAEAEVAELQAQLADPDIYDRPEEVHRLATLHDAAKDRPSH